MFKLTLILVAASLAILPLSAQTGSGAADFKTSFQKHLQTSEEFTLKVADAMPADDYSFKLTKEQMSFGEQMTHLSTAIYRYMGRMTGQKPELLKPASTSKADVMAFLKSSFDFAIAQAATLTQEQMGKSYGSGSQAQTGYDVLMGLLNHTTNHRASAEMYLRVKGITPPTYEF